MSPDLVLALMVTLALMAYTVTGGADYGGGVWDGLASGPRAKAQRDLIKHAIGPIWEANHVWLIVVVVILFACFPLAWSAITTALFIPLVVMLVGVVLRGSAFVFRSNAGPYGDVGRQWNLVFSVASTVTPVMLGVSLAGVATGRIRVDVATARVTSGFFSAWWTPWPWAVGLMVLGLFAFLAAVYLCSETRDEALQEDFRARALASGVALGPLALGTLFFAQSQAPAFFQGLLSGWWAIPWQLLTGALAMGALGALLRRRYWVARILAGAQGAMMVGGFALGMRPHVVIPDVPLGVGMAPQGVQSAVMWVLLVGTPVLVPAFLYLYRTFGMPGAKSH
jgi:cytochrome d ubiquinol oxidase subunit II